MPDPQTTGFIPKWLREESFENDEAFLMAGSIPDSDPRILTRLVPNDHGYRLAAPIVADIIKYKQDLAFFAAQDIADNYNPDFSDVKALDPLLAKRATLLIEPFEAGSFVIPARLEISGDEAVADALPTAEAIVDRFNEILTAIDDPRRLASLSRGALKTCLSLGKVLDRGVEAIEFTTYDREYRAKPTFMYNRERVLRVKTVLDKRGDNAPKKIAYREIRGTLTSIDLQTSKFQVSVANSAKRILGTAVFFDLLEIRDRLGEEIVFEGEIVQNTKATRMKAYKYRLPEDGE